MRIFLDEKAVDLTGGSLRELLDGAREQLAEGGRVVVEVAVDGAKLAEDQITALAEEVMGEKEVRFTSADPRELAVATLEQVRVRLIDAGELQREAADLLAGDDAVAALPKVGESIEGWLQVQQAVLQSAMLLNLDLDKMLVDGQPAHQLTGEALTRLQEIKTYLQENDTISLADALAYEWPEVTTRWNRLLDVMIQTIKQ